MHLQTDGDVQVALVRIGVGVATANWIDLVAAVLLLLDALGQPAPALLEVHGRHFSPRVAAGSFQFRYRRRREISAKLAEAAEIIIIFLSFFFFSFLGKKRSPVVVRRSRNPKIRFRSGDHRRLFSNILGC